MEKANGVGCFSPADSKVKEGKEMNVDLMNKVAAHITANPQCIDMEVTSRNTPCGTVGCIAGWACMLSGEPESTWERAAELLDLKPTEADRLFTEPSASADLDGYVDSEMWPSAIAQEYEEAETQKEKAEIVVRRIGLFVETAGAQ